ncbi:MAG: PHP domain-containing protein [Candidatus Aenigmarchaeota archaeon]|nr:PHP domain-containing protein [Candidatus Aenigmarchaeota archaeon]
MGLIDLHFHSYYSDGIYSPAELAERALKTDRTVLSLTDHNGISGVAEMISEGKRRGLRIISGVEIYTQLQEHNLHLLGYNFDLQNKQLNEQLVKLQQERIPIIKQGIKTLQADNWLINEAEVFKTISVYIGLGHLGGLLKKHNWSRIKQDFAWQEGRILTVTEIIGRYFFQQGKAIFPETFIPIRQAIKLIHQAGGIAVLAHPGQHLSWKEWPIVAQLKKVGLDGLEAISGHHRWEDQEYWQKIARQLDLLITAGSDFHGELPAKWGFPLNSQWDYFKILSEKIKIR